MPSLAHRGLFGVNVWSTPCQSFQLALGLLLFPATTWASWQAAPLEYYPSSPPSRGAAPGVRQFSHHEEHKLEDGSDVMLHWRIEADPTSLMSVDVAQHDGVKLLECKKDRLKVQVPAAYREKVSLWRHVVASDSLHACNHLRGSGQHLYQRVLGVHRISKVDDHVSGFVVELVTEDLQSPTQIFPFLEFNFRYMPFEAKHAYPEQVPRPPRQLSIKTSLTHGSPEYHSGFRPAFREVHNILNLNIPKQMSNLSWNWNYEVNTTRHPEFDVKIPGADGWVRFYKPYFKAHLGVALNFSSHFPKMMQTPHVNLVGELEGFADVNADIATSMDFDKDKAIGLGDQISRFEIPLLSNFTRETVYMRPIKIFLGNTPFSIDPGFNCNLKAFHIGKLQGSSRVGLKTKIALKGDMTFDTAKGLQTNFSAMATDVDFTPPTWMLFTKHFEMGALFEPELWFKGGFGVMRNMKFGISLQPYVNVSVMQQGYETEGANVGAILGGLGDGLTGGRLSNLAVYPFRAIGLPKGRGYAIKVGIRGRYKTTSMQFSMGGVEYVDSVHNFLFGTISEPDLLSKAIDVQLLEDGKASPVAVGQAYCGALVNGECHPNPVEAQLIVEGASVKVHMSVVWTDQPVTALMKKVRAVSLKVPSIYLTQDSVSPSTSLDKGSGYEFQVKRLGSTYSLPLLLGSTSGDAVTLRSSTTLDLGPCFQDSWLIGDGASSDVSLIPVGNLVFRGKVVASTELPELDLEKAESQDSSDTPLSLMNFYNSKSHAAVAKLSLDIVMRSPSGQGALGTGKLDMKVSDSTQAPFWIFPGKVENFVAGQDYHLSWTLKEGIHETSSFVLALFDLDTLTGVMTNTNWTRTFKTTCRLGSPVEVIKATSGLPCIFKYKMTAPGSLVNDLGVFALKWLRDDVHHEMLSSPIKFERRRQLFGPAGGYAGSSATPSSSVGWSRAPSNHPLSWGPQSGQSSGVDFYKHMAAMSRKCDARPLKYGIGVGVFEKTDVDLQQLELPNGLQMLLPEMQMMQSRKNKLMPLFQEGMTKQLSQLLPGGLCAGGFCEGELPGCKPKQVSPIHIKKILFRLSRLFRWKKHVEPGMRRIIAYGLALLPEAVQIGEKELTKKSTTVTSTSTATFTSTTTTSTQTTTMSTSTSFTATETQTSATSTANLSSTTMSRQVAAGSSTSVQNATNAQHRSNQSTLAVPSQSVGTTRHTTFRVMNSSQQSSTMFSMTTVSPVRSTLSMNMSAYQDGLGGNRSAQNPQAQAARRLVDNSDESQPSSEADEFDTFTVHITRPMQYILNEELLRGLINMGAFHGMADGREKTHGPVFIEDFKLLDAPHLETTKDSHANPTLRQRPSNVQLSQPNSRWAAASVMVAAFAAVAVGSSVLFVLKRRRRHYLPLLGYEDPRVVDQ